MNKNDERIIELKKQIADKKKQLSKGKRFTPITNCNLTIGLEGYNLNVLTKAQLTLLLVRLNSYKLSIKDLELDKDAIISGFSLTDWIEDIQSKLTIINYKEEETKLKEMENKLDKLLSDEKKTELELDDIASALLK